MTFGSMVEEEEEIGRDEAGESDEGQRPDPEVRSKARRRQFSPEYKLKIVREAERCKKPGEIGALLRREGLYSSHLVLWRRQVRESALQGMKVQKRGPKPLPKNPLAQKVAELERENRKLQKRLGEAETIIAFQKNCRARRRSSCGEETRGQSSCMDKLTASRSRIVHPRGAAVRLMVRWSP